MTELRIECSPEQTDVILDHCLYDTPLGLQPDERVWMLAKARARYPTCKIIKADLDFETMEWILTLDLGEAT